MKNDLIDILELPKDVIKGIPVISIYGRNFILIDNHRGISEYTENTLVILIKDGKIHVSGSSLEIKEFTKDHISVKGIISSVEFM